MKGIQETLRILEALLNQHQHALAEKVLEKFVEDQLEAADGMKSEKLRVAMEAVMAAEFQMRQAIYGHFPQRKV